jgi:quercetin dioxygenase-like cupin family protein
MSLYRWSEVREERLTGLLSRRIVTGERVMLGLLNLKKGCVIKFHRHENEQLSYLLQGRLKFVLEDGQEIIAQGGEVVHLPSNLGHSVEALEDSVSLDIFSPPREDWLKGQDAYLREK